MKVKSVQLAADDWPIPSMWQTKAPCVSIDARQFMVNYVCYGYLLSDICSAVDLV